METITGGEAPAYWSAPTTYAVTRPDGSTVMMKAVQEPLPASRWYPCALPTSTPERHHVVLDSVPPAIGNTTTAQCAQVA